MPTKRTKQNETEKKKNPFRKNGRNERIVSACRNKTENYTVEKEKKKKKKTQKHMRKIPHS